MPSSRRLLASIRLKRLTHTIKFDLNSESFNKFRGQLFDCIAPQIIKARNLLKSACIKFMSGIYCERVKLDFVQIAKQLLIATLSED